MAEMCTKSTIIISSVVPLKGRDVSIESVTVIEALQCDAHELTGD